MDDVFVGSDAVRQGKLSPYQLRSRFRAVHHDVYVPRFTALSLRDRSVAAWLWSGRGGTLAGVAAAGMHGSDWIADDEPIELIWRNRNSPAGVITRNQRLGVDEVTRIAGLPVTTPARTAFDLGRQLRRGQAVARLDALARATPFPTADVLMLAKRHPGARGLRQLREVLPLLDGWQLVGLLDMGWQEFKVAADDGDQHRSDRRQYVKDIRRFTAMQELGWSVGPGGRRGPARRRHCAGTKSAHPPRFPRHVNHYDDTPARIATGYVSVAVTHTRSAR